MSERYQALVIFDASCALRLGELAGLRRGRIDLLRHQVRVIETAVEVKGELLLDAPKTRAGNRTVPIPPSVGDRLAEHMARFSAAGPDGLVFPGSDGGAPAGERLAAAALASGHQAGRARTAPGTCFPATRTPSWPLSTPSPSARLHPLLTSSRYPFPEIPRVFRGAFRAFRPLPRQRAPSDLRFYRGR